MELSSSFGYGENPAKDAAREKFEKASGTQDRHTGEHSSERKAILQDKRVYQEMKSGYEKQQQGEVMKEQISRGIEEWQNGEFSNIHFEDSADRQAGEANWKEILKNINDTSFDKAMEYVDSNLSQDEYIKMQEAARQQLERDKREAIEERKIRNFSRTGDPSGDRNRTSLVQ